MHSDSFVFVAIRKNWTHQFPTQCNECKHNIPSKQQFKHGLKFSETEEGIVLCMVGCLFGIRAIVHIVLCQGNIKNEKIVLSLPFGCLFGIRDIIRTKRLFCLWWFYDEGRPSGEGGGDRLGPSIVPSRVGRPHNFILYGNWMSSGLSVPLRDFWALTSRLGPNNRLDRLDNGDQIYIDSFTL